MGSWGYSPMSNDISEDIRDEFENKLKDNKDFDTAIKEILEENKDILNDECEASNLWLALAERQWQYGFDNEVIKNKVKKICKNGVGQILWKEEGNKEYLKRMKALEKFFNKISIAKEKPKKRPKLIIRKAIFKKGDCLSIKINSFYACALVLDEDNSDVEYGQNTIALLQCYSKKIPTVNLFHETPYLKHSYYNSDKPIIYEYLMQGFKKFNTQIIKIGNIDISSRNFIKPELLSSCGWESLIEDAENEFKKEFII